MQSACGVTASEKVTFVSVRELGALSGVTVYPNVATKSRCAGPSF